MAACLVGQFVAACRGEVWAEGTEPLVVMATARRCHRADLLRTTFNFVPEDACFIVESGKDHDLGPGDVQSFLNDRAQKKFVEATAEVRKELSLLDSKIAEAKQKEDELSLLTLHTERSFLHYTGLVWGHGDVFQDFARTVKVVICTTEHLKKALQGKARERRLHTLVLDEVEAHSSLDLFALCGHFSQVVCMGDADQRIPEYMVPAKHMPSSDIMCEEVERGNANVPGDPLRKLTSGALEWLWAHGQVHRLRGVHRFGTAVAEFARSFSRRFSELRVHPSAPQTTVQVIKFQNATWESVQEATSVTFHVCLPLLWHILGQAAQQCSSGTVALLFFYKPTILFVEALLKELAEQAPAMLGVSAEDWSRVVVNSPEGALGSTYRHVHFVAVQRRRQGDDSPAGHSLDRARRWVAVSRATHNVAVYVEDMRPAREAETRQLQRLQHQQWLDLSRPTVSPHCLIQ